MAKADSLTTAIKMILNYISVRTSVNSLKASCILTSDNYFDYLLAAAFHFIKYPAVMPGQAYIPF